MAVNSKRQCMRCGDQFSEGLLHRCDDMAGSGVFPTMETVLANSFLIREAGATLPPNPKQAFGDKKPSLHLVPPAALLYLALALRNGAEKYGLYNWRDKAVETMTYVGATLRHLEAWVDGEDLADDTGLPHLAHAMASLAILVDALELGNAIDTRPLPGAFARLIEKWSTPKDDEFLRAAEFAQAHRVDRDAAGVEARITEIASRAPPVCPDLDGDVWCQPGICQRCGRPHSDCLCTPG